MSFTIQLRRDTAAHWTSKNPVLASGELGIETDTRSAKLGDGVTAWASLAYWDPALSGAEAYTDAETARAEAAESTLNDSIVGALSTISAETTRAEAAEAANAAAIADEYFANQSIASGESSLPRLNCGGGAPLVSGKVALTFWTAAKTETINQIGANANSIAAGATPSYCAMGCYRVNGDGSLTLMGQCASDTTLFSTTFLQYVRPVTTPFQKVAGTRYAFAVLVISSFAMPNLFGYNGTIPFSSTPPLIAASVFGQPSLPASVAAANVINTSNAYFGVVTP